MVFSKKARHRARRLAMQALYQWQYTTAPDASELIATLLASQRATKFDQAYFETLVRGVLAIVEQLDAVLAPVLDRELAALDPIELSILRLATYELLHQPDVPYRVIINEAVTLGQDFGSVQGYQYINAILDKLANQYRVAEIRNTQA